MLLTRLAQRFLPPSAKQLLRGIIRDRRRGSIDAEQAWNASREADHCRRLGLRYRLEKCSDGLTHAIPEIMTDAEIAAVLQPALGLSGEQYQATRAEFGELWERKLEPRLIEVSHQLGRPMPPHPDSYTTLARQEAFALYAVVKHRQVANILDIGGMIGFSAWIFHEFLAHLGRVGQVHTIDADREGLFLIDDADSYVIDYAQQPSRLRGEAMRGHPFVKHFGYSEEVLPRLLDTAAFDLVFHDCAHTWDNTWYNVSTCLDRCGRHTVFACHDWRLAYRKNDDRYAERQIFNHFFGKGFRYFGVVELYGVGVAWRAG